MEKLLFRKNKDKDESFSARYEHDDCDVDIDIYLNMSAYNAPDTWAYALTILHKETTELCTELDECDWGEATVDESGTFHPCNDCLEKNWSYVGPSGAAGKSRIEAIEITKEALSSAAKQHQLTILQTIATYEWEFSVP